MGVPKCPKCDTISFVPDINNKAWLCLDCDFKSGFNGTPGGEAYMPKAEKI